LRQWPLCRPLCYIGPLPLSTAHPAATCTALRAPGAFIRCWTGLAGGRLVGPGMIPGPLHAWCNVTKREKWFIWALALVVCLAAVELSFCLMMPAAGQNRGVLDFLDALRSRIRF
jgi:hypothetical protein